VILGVNLNLRFKIREIRGENARLGPLEEYFSHLFKELCLFYVELIEMVPTWRNFGSGNERVSNRFMVTKKVIEEASRSPSNPSLD
jgi:hypothetical protein